MRKAVDTNVFVRLFVEDNPDQYRRANAVFDAHTVFVLNTVLIESEWVLRSIYNFSPKQIVPLMQAALEVRSIEFEDIQIVRKAVSAFALGMDFADAIHLFSAIDCDEFFSFDDPFRRKALKVPNSIKVTDPPKVPIKTQK
jgi:predicted nucleic-acid-binding protein